MKIIDAHLHLFSNEDSWPEEKAQSVGHHNSADHLREAYGKLDASHLVELLRAPEEDRDALAAKAAEEALSTRALREEIKQLREDHAQAQGLHDPLL